jgi:hypothetical protein
MFLALAVLSLAQPAQAAHQGHAAPAAAPTAAPAAARFSTANTIIADLLANDAAKAVLERHLPGFSQHPQISMAARMTLRAVQGFAPQQLTNERLDAIDAELAALPAR